MRFCEGQSYVTERQIDMSPLGCIPAGTVLQVTDVQHWNGMVVFEFVHDKPADLIVSSNWDLSRIELCGDDLLKLGPYVAPFMRVGALARAGVVRAAKIAGVALLGMSVMSELGGDLAHLFIAKFSTYHGLRDYTVSASANEAIKQIEEQQEQPCVRMSWTADYFPQCVRRN